MCEVRILLPWVIMRLSKVLVGSSAAAVVGLGAVLLVRSLRGRRRVSAHETAGSMFVGAVDEVEISGGLARPRYDTVPESFDPEEVPSEHSEINDLRNKMPFG